MTSLNHKLTLWLQRPLYLLGIIALFAINFTAIAEAAVGQTVNRSIKMSDSAPSGTTITSGVGSGTNVDYKVTFTESAATAIGGIVVDFCSTSALYFDTCVAPTGFNANSATTQIYNQTNTGSGAFAVYTTTPVANRIIISRTTPAAPTAGTATSVEIGNGTTNGITNPSTTGSFYARVYTYDTAAHAQAHVQATSDNFVVDFGAVALSTVTVITINARVQESLIFCVSAASPTSNCGGTTSPALLLGSGTAPNKVLDSQAVYTGTVYSQLSTNAVNGATVNIHNSASGGGLATVSGSTIPPASSGAATAGTVTAGTAAFGLQIGAGSGGTGSVTVAAPYNGTGSNYGMDTTSTTNATTTFGSTAYQSAAPVNNVTNTWTFAATAANTTPAGLYAANIAAIATGAF